MITHTAQVFDATAADHYHGVLLKLVPHAGDVRRHLHAVRQTHARDLANSGVRLLWRRCRYLRANSTLEWGIVIDRYIFLGIETLTERDRTRLLARSRTGAFGQLIDGCHIKSQSRP